MRIWSIHPKYLDVKGLLALWRETLLAQNVLLGNTKGYKNHPQLLRFKNHPASLNAISNYLHEVYFEAYKRGYNFNREKILYKKTAITLIKVNLGQVNYEWQHFLKKIEVRENLLFQTLKVLKKVEPHPVFFIADGEVESWEIL